MSAKPQATTTALPLTYTKQEEKSDDFTDNVDNGPFVDAGVYCYERNRRSHEFFSPGPHRYE